MSGTGGEEPDVGDRQDGRAALILDGAVGTELERRGIDVALPLWSARALLDARGRAVLCQIHADYVAAGAQVLTGNTFRTHRRSLARAGLAERADELTRTAVALARAAARERAGVRVAGSLAPLEDCYRPDLVPPDDVLAAEHAEQARRLADAGCDLILVETMGTVREAVAATRAAVATGLPVWVCFVCGLDVHLLSGEPLAVAAAAVVPLGVAAVGLNCTPAPLVAAGLRQLPTHLDRVAYGNVGRPDPNGHWVRTDAAEPETYARYALTWAAAVIGGCCGTTPAHIRAVVAALRAGGVA